MPPVVIDRGMATISANIVRRMIAIADDAVSREDLLEVVGLATLQPDPGRGPAIADQAYYELIERATRGGDHTFPLRYGDAVEPGTFGALGHAIATAPTLRDALQRLSRYIMVISDTLEWELRESGGGAVLHLLGRTEARRGTQLSNECAIAAITSTMRQIAATPVCPTLVTFRHAAPPTTADHERWFDCPVRFETPSTAVHLSERVLAARTRLGDAGLSAYLLSQLDDLREQHGERSVVLRVRAAVADTLCDGVPTKAEVARRLGMSERTLHRRLAEHDASFQDVADAVRLDIARSLLSDGDRPLGEVAFFTGFSAQSAFTRAFKRWTGQTPLGYRRTARAGAART